MAVDRADVPEAQLLEKRSRHAILDDVERILVRTDQVILGLEIIEACYAHEGRFNMDAFSIWAVMETQSVKGTKSSTNQEIDTTHLGVSYKMANNTFALTYTDADSSQADYDATSLALGVIHALSKNTAIKGLYTTVDNDRLASRSGSILSSTSITSANDSGSIFAGVGITTGTAADKDPSALEVQLSVSF